MPQQFTSALKTLGIMVFCALVFAWFGVYQTGRMPFAPRFGMWFMTMVIGWASAFLVGPLVQERWLRKAHWLVQAMAVAALVSVPITLALVGFYNQSNFSSPAALAMQYGYVLAVSALLSTVWVGFETFRAVPAEMGTAPDPVAEFLSRLPVKYRTASLYAVSAEDHYLRVHTSSGEELILMRLSDALRELEKADGLQTHRSWWVAAEGVADTVRENGKLWLVLKSGARAAVSRTYLPAVKAAGLAQ